MDVNTLLADPVATRIEKLVSLDNSILIVVRTIRPAATCPKCSQPSGSLKSRYQRRLADLPWHNVSVRIELLTRKFRCRNELCPKKVFCERLEKVAAPFARRTARLNNVIELLAFALGARPAARAVSEMICPVGKDIFLRVVRRRRADPQGEMLKVRVLGVDDFAFRRGVNYGTILVDLEQRKPIDLLPDRTAETLNKWLKAHPEVEIVSRDRSPVYAEAVTSGSPHAAQVADRWHLLKNLGEMVERYFIQNHCLLAQTAAQICFEKQPREQAIQLPNPEKLDNKSNIDKPIPARRQKLFDSIKQLQSKGMSIRAIARELKIARNTVRKYAACQGFPIYRSRAGSKSAVLPFIGIIQKRWREGEQNASRLWREIKAQGFSGEVDAVRRLVRHWRKTGVGGTVCSISANGLAPRKAAQLLLNPESANTDDEGTYLVKLCCNNPDVNKLQELGISFQKMVKEKRADLFDEWLEKVKKSEIRELQNWANGLLVDEKAVRNALSLVWSNGQVEGQVNRLKTIKRAMYGRAKFDLLRARVLHRA